MANQGGLGEWHVYYTRLYDAIEKEIRGIATVIPHLYTYITKEYYRVTMSDNTENEAIVDYT